MGEGSSRIAELSAIWTLKELRWWALSRTRIVPLSFTPGFSPVMAARRDAWNRFNGLPS